MGFSSVSVVQEDILAVEMTPDALEVESEDVATGENDVIVVEESVTLPAELEVTIDGTSIEEEVLLLGNTVSTESPVLEDLPTDPTSPEQPEGATLPEPPLEIEASGSGVHVPKDLPFQPEDMMEAPEPVGDLNVPENPPAIVTLPPDEPEEETNVVLAYPEIPDYGEEVESLEEGPIIEVPVTEEDAVEEKVVAEVPDVSEISEEDFVEDEILLVVEAAPEATHPTPLSAEKESPFTRVSDVIVGEEVTEATALDTAPEPEAEQEDQGVTPALIPAEYHPGPDISITLEVMTDD